MPHKELECEIYCPSCGNLYGSLFRVARGPGQWSYETVPASVPKYCTVCETPLERKHGTQ